MFEAHDGWYRVSLADKRAAVVFERPSAFKTDLTNLMQFIMQGAGRDIKDSEDTNKRKSIDRKKLNCEIRLEEPPS